MITSSYGPIIELVALAKTIGSLGMGNPCSAAWSEKLSPIPINFSGFEMQEPILISEEISGKVLAFKVLILLIFSNIKVEGSKSFK
jgi:hypothetical protein